MASNIYSKIVYPYNEMLMSLESVQGFDSYIEYINGRINSDHDWKSEIKALFEINKNNHPLIELCSHKPAEPEGIFKVNNDLGIIEAAFIRYLFDMNYARKKLVNNITNWIAPLTKFLFGDYSDFVILINLYTSDIRLYDTDLERIRKSINDFFRDDKEKKNMAIINPLVLIIVCPRNDPPFRITQDYEISMMFTRTGTIVKGYNTNIQRKIRQLLRDKRKQHIAKYNDYIKVYYFYVDCPDTGLNKIDKKEIQKNIKDYELIVVCAVSMSDFKLIENKIIMGNNENICNSFDFSNKFISTTYL